MKGSAYTWGFLLPASVLWCTALWLSCHAKEVAKIAAGMQVDARVRSKLAKRRNLQINLFVRVSLGASGGVWGGEAKCVLRIIGFDIKPLNMCTCLSLSLLVWAQSSFIARKQYGEQAIHKRSVQHNVAVSAVVCSTQTACT